ncbi:hypothetical protein BsWGS_27727 [Bradybaena similaris]
MEDILGQLARDIITPKFANIKHTANTAIDILKDEDKLKKIEAWELREICLHPLLLALETRARRLGHTALVGIQVMFKDDRFRSSMETSDEDKWLPSQVLSVLTVAHSLSEDLQIEVMKLLLNMTVTASWCTSAKTIVKIAQVYIGSYQNCVMVQGAVQAAFITMLNKFVGGLVEMEEAVVDDRDDVLADFKSNSKAVPTANLISEVVLILTFLTDRLEVVASVPEGKQTLPLLLEGVNTVLAKVQSTIKHNSDFQKLLWQRLCPCLISLLGEPKAEKTPGGQKAGWPEISRSTGKSTSSPNITQASAKVIYSIAGELASLVGSIPPLRPVLESLFHKILMFPLPPNRHDALRVLKELMSDPAKVVSLIGSVPVPGLHRDVDSSMALMKMLIDSIQQSSHVNDAAIVYTCVSCISSLLASLDRIRLGEAIPDNMLKPVKGSRTHARRSMTSNPDDDGGSDLTSDLYEETQDPIADPTKDLRSIESISPAPVSEGTKTNSSSSSQSPARAKFEAEERENAQQFVQCLRQAVPVMMDSMSVWEVDESLQDLAARFCSSLPQNSLESQSDMSISGVVLNSDGVYVAAITALKLNLRLLTSGYYVNRQNVPMSEGDFLNEMFSSGLLLYLPPAWLKELYSQILGSSILSAEAVTACSTSRIYKSSSPLINFLQDLEGVGTTEEGGRLMSDFREWPSAADGDEGDRIRRAEVGKCLAASVLSACWSQMLDILSVTLNDQVAIAGTGGMALYSLSLLLATDSAQEDVRRARSAICASLDGFQRAAKLCCALGLQQLCGSAFSQLARTSCVKEDFRVVAATESKGQGKPSVLASSKPKLVKLHAAHLLSMDVVMTTGLEIGSHAADCWKHVFRCCAHISELEHIYFSQGNNQSSLPKVMPGSQVEPGQDLDGTEADGNCNTDIYTTPLVAAAVPVAPRINVPALIQQSGLESGWDNSLAAGGVLTFAQASKVLCGLSQEVDSFFENAADKLCLEALLSMLMELGEAMLVQLQKLSGAKEGLAAGGAAAATRPPINALHLYRLQQVLVRVVNSPRPLLHLLRVWSVVSAYLVQATGNSDHVISKMAVSSIHEFIVSLVSQREERPHFHVNEFVCKMFEDMLCLELCDGDVQDQIVCCICELVEACSSQLQSGWRPLFGALRSVKIEYTTSEAVNEARQRHIAAVMDVFDVYLGMDNVAMFASATVDCVLCLLKYVHGPATFNSDFSGDRSDSGSDDGYGDAEGELENLCVPALKYLTRVCDILATMWQMPACPVFKGAHRIQVDSASRFVDGEIPFMNFKDFAEEFSLDKYQNYSVTELDKRNEESVSAEQDTGTPVSTSCDQDQNGRKISLTLGSELPVSCDGMLDNKSIHSLDVEDAVQQLDDEPNHQEELESEVSDSDRNRRDDILHEVDQTASELTTSLENAEAHDSQCANDESRDSQFVSDTSDVFHDRPCESYDVSRDKKATASVEGGRSSHTHKKSADCENIKQLYRSQSLDDMDNESGILHVWFLLMDGLVSAINRCPKMVQSNVLTTLIDLLRSAAIVPGPEFSIHCMNHLLLPMMQSWLRRGARCYGYWNTGINSFKQCCGLVADLVVEFVTRFSDLPGLDVPLQLLLKQMFDVLIECVAQPVENISRLGCSCIRHILLTAGPHLSETLRQVGALAVRRALSVSTYNLQLLMALFHPNSDNFYGDIGQVKVATRKDCTVVDCLRLRQMARQVFLLDCQISSMPDVHYDTDQDKSFVFLLYPPGHQDSLNPDHISTRVPFRHVVVGLLSSQLLLQTIGSVLLQQGDDTSKEADKHKGLPGQMGYMSTRNISQFLAALEDVFKLAQDFDARPGLKFLLQKVASLDVAANLYKQMATAVLFYVHALVEVCAHLDDSNITSTRAAISQAEGTPESHGATSCVADLKQLAHTSLAKPWTSGNIFLPLLQNICEELCESYVQVLQDAGKSSILDKISEKPIFFLTAQHDDISQIASQAQLAAERTKSQKQHKPKAAELHNSKSIEGSQGGQGMGAMSVSVTRPQGRVSTDEDSDSEVEAENKTGNTQEDEDEERIKSKREIRAEMQSKVYTVATDQIIENLMSQYKRHKHQRSMPNFIRAPKFQRKPKIPRREAVDEAIDKQQTSSIMKDSEARTQAWSDTLTAVLQMTMNLPDQSFSALLPVTYPIVSQLILYASDSALRDQLARCFSRLGRLYNFAPSASSGSQRPGPEAAGPAATAAS